MEKSRKRKERYGLIDSLRGIAVIHMVLYHTLWDLVYIYRVPIGWMETKVGFLFQQSILWSFLLISGFCCCMGKRKLRHGLLCLGGSALVTAATMITMPGQPVVFGVLTLLGVAILLTIPLEKLFRKLPALPGAIVCLLLVLLLEQADRGMISFFGYPILELPQWLYRNLLTACIGFPPPSFATVDYVPVIPYVFLFWTGTFLYELLRRKQWLGYLAKPKIPLLHWIGKHALIIYLAHQPIVYGVLLVVFHLGGMG